MIFSFILQSGNINVIEKNNASDMCRHFDLPNTLLTNLQSFGKSGKSDKTTELELVLQLNNIDVGVFSETWATDSAIKSLEFEDYTMFHSIRDNCRRSSGGLSIFVKSTFPAKKLDIIVPDHLEVLYVSLRPNKLPRSVSNIVLIGLYYPGTNSIYAPPQEDLILHINESIQFLYNKFSKPLIMLLGDFNDLKIIDISETCSLKQVVTVPTRKNAILDLILTNLDNNLYKDPITLPSIGTSDHLCVVYEPKNYVKQETTKKKISVRKFKQSAKIGFGAWITQFDWSVLFKLNCVNKKVMYFSSITWEMVEKFFPVKTITISSSDKEWMTLKIKNLIIMRQKSHKLDNKEMRNHLAKRVRQEIRKAKIDFHTSKAHLFHMSNPKEWYNHINKLMGNKNQMLNFTNIPELANKCYDDQLKIVNEHFARICKMYPPINENVMLNDDLIEKNIPSISELETFKLLNKYSKKSLGHGDLPKSIIQEFAPELATPFCDIINCSLKSNIFPDAYKKAEIIPIPKVNPPLSLSDLRPISKTPIGGKMIEKVLVSELEKDVKGKLDSSQYGNCGGSGTTHYLIKLTDQAFKSTDIGDATSAIMIDYAKAFDYVDHNILIQKLVSMGVRKSIVKLFIYFLTNRSHNTSIFAKKSEFLGITCGVPQGTVSGPRLFVILINGDKCPLVTNLKFVDDKTLVHSYSGDPTKNSARGLRNRIGGNLKRQNDNQ